MTWTTPRDWADHEVVSPSVMNSAIRDNMWAAAPSVSAFINVVETTSTMVTYGNLNTVGPDVTVNVAGSALVLFTAQMWHNTTGRACFAAVAVDPSGGGRAAQDSEAIILDTGVATELFHAMGAVYITGLTPGSHLFRMQYKVDVAGGLGSFSRRGLLVQPVGP